VGWEAMQELSANASLEQLTITNSLQKLHDVPIPIFAVDRRREIFFSNHAFSHIANMGYTEEQCCDDLSDLESLFAVELLTAFKSTIENSIPTDSEVFTFNDRHNNSLSLSIVFTPLSFDGQIVGALGTVMDISDSRGANASLEKRIRELHTIEEISRALHSTMKTEDILRMILVGATCREGLGFNRAFLFLLKESENVLEGRVAIGPSTAEEAGRIWSEIDSEPRRLQEVLRQYLDHVAEYDIEVNQIVRSLRIDLSTDSVFGRIITAGSWINIWEDEQLGTADYPFCDTIRTRRFAIVPLLSKGRAIGAILADNAITSRPIDENAIRLLQIFADHAASAIENAKLFEELGQKAASLERAHLKLEKVQKQIIAIERSQLLAQVTHKIAHEIRNPIATIGGFAGLLNSHIDSADKVKEYGAIIMEETLRVEKALTEVLNFSKSFADERMEVDLIDVVRSTLDVLEQEQSNLQISVDFNNAPNPALVRVNRDQTVQALYDLLTVLADNCPENTPLTLYITRGQEGFLIEIHPIIDGSQASEIDNALRELLQARSQGDSLKLTLAFETIRFNGGEPGIATSFDGACYLYLTYPAVEGEYA
jgi:hypothetical protein